MTEYTIIATLPAWVLVWTDNILVFVARLTGHKIIISSVKPVPVAEPSDE